MGTNAPFLQGGGSGTRKVITDLFFYCRFNPNHFDANPDRFDANPDNFDYNPDCLIRIRIISMQTWIILIHESKSL